MLPIAHRVFHPKGGVEGNMQGCDPGGHHQHTTPNRLLNQVGLVRPKLGPLHTRDREPVTITLQALSLVEKVEPVKVCFTLRLRDQQSMRMQDGCKVYMGSYVALNGSCFMVTWIIFKNHFLEVCLTQN